MKRAPLILLLAFWASVQADAKQFLVISDIHFNPLADPSLAKQLLSAEPSQWEAILTADSNYQLQHYGEDSAWPLISSLVSEVQNLNPKPQMVILTGDILGHKFQEKVAAALHNNDPGELRVFVRKTVDFVGLELQKAARGAPVIYTIGNNDQDCGDYALQPGGPFLVDSAEVVHSLAYLGDLVSWKAIGSYEIANPLAYHHRVIALNTNFWSRRYVNTCGTPASDPGQAVMQWLTDQLADAERHHDKVWLAYHIPPGIDGHSSSRANQVVTMWKQPYADAFNKLLDHYRQTIELNLAGHTHLDDIRLVKTDHTTTLVLINPGLSPNVGQNPAFRVFTVDSHAAIKDVLTYYMPDMATLQWKLEYSIRPTYALKHIDAKSYQLLYQQINESPNLADKWKLYYSVSRPAGLADNKTYLRSLYCATGNSTLESYQACLSAATSK